MKESRESERVIDSSTTCRIESVLIDGIRRKKRALTAIPLNTRSLNIPFTVAKITSRIIPYYPDSTKMSRKKRGLIFINPHVTN